MSEEINDLKQVFATGKRPTGEDFSKLIDGLKPEVTTKDIEGITSQLADIAVNPKQYGAAASGLTDDTQAIQNALAENDVVNISGGTFLVNGSIKLEPGKCLKGDKTGTILIAHDKPITTFEMTYSNEVYGFNIRQTNSQWSGNMFEESSKTLENTNAPVFVNLRNEIHDIAIFPESDYGTFLEISAYTKDESGNSYRVYGIWNSKVYNIKLKGYLEYFCRTYTFSESGEPTPWITVNEFDNITGDYLGYGWFGSKSVSTMEDIRYKNLNIRVRNAVLQCYEKSKNFAFLSGGDAQFIDCIPFDWVNENISKQNAFLLSNIDTTLPKVLIRNTHGDFDLLAPVSNYQEREIIVNKSVIKDSNHNLPLEKSTHAFQIGDFGGATFPTYKRIARFPAYEQMSTFFILHNEISQSISTEYALRYYAETDELYVKTKRSDGYMTGGIRFYHEVDNEGYVSVYIMLTISSIGWYIETLPPPDGDAERLYIYLSVRDYGNDLDVSNMKETIPVLAHTYAGDSVEIFPDNSYAGAVGYDKEKGMLGFGRKSEGFTYSPVIITQEHTAVAEIDTVVFVEALWNLDPKILIQPLEATTVIPFPSFISTSSATVNNLEVGKKYLITLLYTGR